MTLNILHTYILVIIFQNTVHREKFVLYRKVIQNQIHISQENFSPNHRKSPLMKNSIISDIQSNDLISNDTNLTH